MRDVRWRQGTSVHAFVDVNARVSAQPPVQLAVADIERDHARRAALQQDVGEAAGRGADVQGAFARRVHAEVVEGMRQLDAAAADVRMIRHRDLEVRAIGDGRAGFRDDLAVDSHAAGHDQGSCTLAGGRKPAFHERDIEAGLSRWHASSSGATQPTRR